MATGRPLNKAAFEAIDKFITETVALTTQQAEWLEAAEGFISEPMQARARQMLEQATRQNSFVLGATIVDLFGRGKPAYIEHHELARMGEITGIAYDPENNNYAAAVDTPSGPDIWLLVDARQLAIGAIVASHTPRTP